MDDQSVMTVRLQALKTGMRMMTGKSEVRK